jgi:hypothetical protein
MERDFFDPTPEKQVVVLIHNAMLHLLGSNPTIFLIVWSSIVVVGAEQSLSDALQ